MKITILGLGRMGRPLARNLLEDGHAVTLYRRHAEQQLPGELAGARSAFQIAEAVAEAQVALSVVSDDAAEEVLCFGPGGLLQSLRPGAVHLCLSTIGPATSLRLALAHQDASQGYVAAPILGSPRAAANRQVWFIAGGPDDHVVRCLGLLEALGRGVTRVGIRADQAHALKLGAHAFSMAVIGALAETLAFGEKTGYSPASFLRLLNMGQFKSPQADAWGALMVRHDHEPSDQTLDQAALGVELLQAAARDLGLTLPLAGHLSAQLAKACEEGLGGLDVTALSMIRRREAGLPGPWTTQAPDRAAAPARPALTAVPEPRTASQPVVTPEVPAPAAPSQPVPPAIPAVHAGGRHGRGRGSHPDHGGPAAAAAQEPVPPGPAPGPEPVFPPTPGPGPEPTFPPTPASGPEPERVAPPAAVPAAPAPAGPDPDPLPTWTPPPAWTWTRHVPIQAAGGWVPAPQPPSAPPVPAPPGPPPGQPVPERTAPPAVPLPGPAPAPAPAAVLPTEPDPNLYYEEDGGAVWGYRDGQHHPTPWRRLSDAEFGVTEVTLVRISRNRSLNPHAVREFEPLFGGRSRVQLTDGQVLVLGREPTRKLKFILGV